MVSYKALNTIIKSVIANRGDASRYYYVRQTSTTAKSHPFNRNNTKGYHNTSQASTINKGYFSY